MLPKWNDYYPTASEMHLVLSYKTLNPQAHSSSFQTWLTDTNPRELARFDRVTIQHLLTCSSPSLLVFLCFNESVCDGNITTTTEISSTVDKTVQMSECACGLITAGKHASAIWLKCKDALSEPSPKRSIAATLILPVRVWQPYSWVSPLHPIYFHHCVHDLSCKRATAANLGEHKCIGGCSTRLKQEQVGRPS